MEELITGGTDYHRIDCPNLPDSNGYIAFKSNEIKYDKLMGKDGKYKYDHKNLGCYICINNNNYVSTFWDKANSDSYYERINNIKDIQNGSINSNKVIAGYIGLGAMRQGTYKTNALTVSEGYKVDNSNIYCKQYKKNDTCSINNIDTSIKKIELTFDNAGYSEGRGLGYVTINVNGSDYNIGMNVTQTITIDRPIDRTITIGVNNENGYVNLKSIKYIYK